VAENRFRYPLGGITTQHRRLPFHGLAELARAAGGGGGAVAAPAGRASFL